METILSLVYYNDPVHYLFTIREKINHKLQLEFNNSQFVSQLYQHLTFQNYLNTFGTFRKHFGFKFFVLW